MNDIFISYAREDRQAASALSQHIKQAGWTAWWDHALNPGDSFRAVIEEQLRTARLVFVLWSRHSVKSPFVLDEASRAQRRGVLVPIIVDDIDPETLPLGFGGLHSVNLSDWQGNANHEGYQRLLGLLTSRLGTKTIPAATEPASTTKQAPPPSEKIPTPKPPAAPVAAAAPSRRNNAASQPVPVQQLHEELPALAARSEVRAIAFYLTFILTGQGLLLNLLFEIRQDWNLWLAISIPAMTFGAAGMALARRSLRKALIIAAISIVLGLIIFLAAPG